MYEDNNVHSDDVNTGNYESSVKLFNRPDCTLASGALKEIFAFNILLEFGSFNKDNKNYAPGGK